MKLAEPGPPGAALALGTLGGGRGGGGAGYVLVVSINTPDETLFSPPPR